MIAVHQIQLKEFEKILLAPIILGHEVIQIPPQTRVDSMAEGKYTIAENVDLKKFSITKVKNNECITYEISKETYLRIMEILAPNVPIANYKEMQLPCDFAASFENQAVTFYNLTPLR